jgi:hypothetical protein
LHLKNFHEHLLFNLTQKGNIYINVSSVFIAAALSKTLIARHYDKFHSELKRKLELLRCTWMKFIQICLLFFFPKQYIHSKNNYFYNWAETLHQNYVSSMILSYVDSNLSILSVPDEGYSRNASCMLNLIFMILCLFIWKYEKSLVFKINLNSQYFKYFDIFL